MDKMGLDSLSIHGAMKHTNFNEHIFPIFQTSTFMFENVDQGAKRFAREEEGYIYTRLGNPTVDFLAERLALLEEGDVCRLYPTGMAAISTVLLALLNEGDHMIIEPVVYGCTDSLARNHLSRYGVKVDFVDTSDPKNVEKAMRENTRVVFLETPANPTLKVCDIREISRISHDYNPEIKVVVDNTFATPVYQQPLKLGADVSLHSCTKYICGHGDVVAGAAIFGRDLEKKMRSTQVDIGTTISPFDAWLLIRGLKTLPLRMRKHTENAEKVVEYLKEQKGVQNVVYPGFSGIISFDMKGGIAAGEKLLNNVKMIGLAVSLGNVDSLIQHPASMTHAIIPRKQREKVGITDGLVRLSVGIENVEDIIADLDQALHGKS